MKRHNIVVLVNTALVVFAPASMVFTLRDMLVSWFSNTPGFTFAFGLFLGVCLSLPAIAFSPQNSPYTGEKQ